MAEDKDQIRVTILRRNGEPETKAWEAAIEVDLIQDDFVSFGDVFDKLKENGINTIEKIREDFHRPRWIPSIRERP